ncbi:glycosyltransferase [Neolewinella sp.]|uniref:glycosyltransferase n=1 Tax=Neolewinella sp. TaxID=2993543 RepID=UPI003B52C4FD
MGWPAPLPLLLALLYAVWQGYNLYFWRRAIARYFPDPDGQLSIALLVPFRNEAVHLPALVQDLLEQDYPPDRYEIILLDDHSTDESAAVAGASPVEPELRLLRLQDHPAYATTVAHKKAALQLGIDHTTAELIVTTDADCRWPAGTLSELNRVVQAGYDVVLGPVGIAPVYGACSAFQALDVLGYQLFTAAAVAAGTPALANGAHLAFRRTAFVGVGGYAGVDHLPSGDDVLLLHKFVAAGMRIGCSTAPATMVTTKPEAGWGAMFRQRIRWAGKAGSYGSAALSIAQGLAFLASLSILVGLLCGAYDSQFLGFALLAWLVKGMADGVLLRTVCQHYGRGELMRWYALAQLIYPFYLVGVGTATLLGVRVKWKGRVATALAVTLLQISVA